MKRINARMMTVVTTIENEMVTIMSVHALQCGRSTEKKDLFCDNLIVEMLTVQSEEKSPYIEEFYCFL